MAMWKYISKPARLKRIKELSSIMFRRHQALYEQELRSGTYNAKKPSDAMIKARYWLVFAQNSYSFGVEKHRYSCDMRWAWRAYSICQDFDALRDRERANR